jgi:hypothetical protein
MHDVCFQPMKIELREECQQLVAARLPLSVRQLGAGQEPAENVSRRAHNSRRLWCDWKSTMD